MLSNRLPPSQFLYASKSFFLLSMLQGSSCFWLAKSSFHAIPGQKLHPDNLTMIRSLAQGSEWFPLLSLKSS